MDTVFMVKIIITIFIWIATLVVLLGCPKNKGRTWLLSFTVLSLVSALGFALVGPFGRYLMIIGLTPPYGLQPFYLLLNIISLAAAVCLLVYAIVKKTESEIPSREHIVRPYPEPSATQPTPADGPAIPNTSHPLFGVKGWLKTIVVVNLYVSPILFALVQLIAWTGYVMLASRYPGAILVGLINTAVGGYLVFRGIHVAKDLIPV